MNSFFKPILLFFLIFFPFYAESLEIQTGNEMVRIAYSAKSGVEVFADAPDGLWCEDILTLKVFAQDSQVFEQSALDILMGKIGAVLGEKCSNAKQLLIEGYSQNVLVYQGSASEFSNWKTQKGTLQVKIRQLQAAAVNTARTESAFPVKEWQPPVGKQKITAHIDKKTALEYQIFSKNKACSILYTTDSPASKVKNWSISVGRNSCDDNLIYGRAEVSLFNEKGNFIRTLDGYFTEGRWTGKKNLNVVLLNRYGVSKTNQTLSYLIDSDADLKIHYIGYLKSTKKSGSYSAWNGCNPFTIAAVTENEELFLEESIVDNILRTAESFADVVCYGAKEMKFFATTVPQYVAGMDMPEEVKKSSDKAYDERLIYSAVLKRKRGKAWKLVSDKTQNIARMKEASKKTEDLREHQLMMVDYSDLKKSDYLGRLAYMIGVDKVDNLSTMLLASALTDKSLRVNLLVNVSSFHLDKAFADWPDSLTMTKASGLFNNTGWHLVSGYLAQAKQGNKKLTGQLELTSAYPCEQDACAEVEDLVGLIRRRHEKPNWTPYHAPYGQGM